MGRKVLGPQFGGRDALMSPSELLPLAQDRVSDPRDRAHVQDIAGRIKKQGYRSAQHDSNPTRPDLSSHIWVVRTDDDSWVENGNHRVHALGLAGYSKKVPVRLTDLRTKRN